MNGISSALPSGRSTMITTSASSRGTGAGGGSQKSQPAWYSRSHVLAQQSRTPSVDSSPQRGSSPQHGGSSDVASAKVDSRSCPIRIGGGGTSSATTGCNGASAGASATGLLARRAGRGTAHPSCKQYASSMLNSTSSAVCWSCRRQRASTACTKPESTATIMQKMIAIEKSITWPNSTIRNLRRPRAHARVARAGRTRGSHAPSPPRALNRSHDAARALSAARAASLTRRQARGCIAHAQ
eukprot:2506097-Prymnesium_polylepis.1